MCVMTAEIHLTFERSVVSCIFALCSLAHWQWELRDQSVVNVIKLQTR